MVAIVPMAIAIFVLLIVFIILYLLADKVDKEDEIKKQWEEYYRQYEYWSGYMCQ